MMKWMDTHVHLSNAGGWSISGNDFVENLRNVFAIPDTELHFVASPEFYSDKTADEISIANNFIRELSQECKDHVYGSCCVNPNYPDESLRLMETAFEKWGFVQVGEFLQYMMNYKMDAPSTRRIAKKAIEYGVPLQVHISTSNAKVHPSSFGDEQLLDVFRLVDHVPDVKCILAHFVGTMRNDPPVVDGYLELIEKEYGNWPDNFWLEIRDFNSPGVKSVLNFAPIEKILAGTDWVPKFGPPFPAYGTIFEPNIIQEDCEVIPIHEMIEILSSCGVDESGVEAIAYKNACTLYGLD